MTNPQDTYDPDRAAELFAASGDHDDRLAEWITDQIDEPDFKERIGPAAYKALTEQYQAHSRFDHDVADWVADQQADR